MWIALQRSFLAERGPCPSDAAGAGDGLAAATPVRPGQDDRRPMAIARRQADQEVAQLRDADRDEPVVRRRSPFPRTAVARSARASRASVVWRCQPAQE